MGLLKHKVKGATLIEALVAIIVVAITFVMSAMIYINIISSDNSFQKLEATSIVKKLVIDTYANSNFIDTTMTQDSITIIKSVSKYPGISNAMLLSINAHGPNKRSLASYNEIILQ